MNLRRTAILPLIALVAFAPAGSAEAAKKPKAKVAEITRVTPMRVQVGASITVRGKNFSSNRRRNTVVFRAPDGRTAFSKPSKASRKRLVVKVPAALARIVGKKSTRFKLRVLTKRFGKWTGKRLSPVVIGSGAVDPITGKPAGQSTCLAGDYDGDLIPGASETDLNLNPCLSDTDGDGVGDGYEFQSARDLNFYPGQTPIPFPGKRPYANPLDPSDASKDYDGDGLTLHDEHLMWFRFSSDGVKRGGNPGTLENLTYSDGLQRSVAVPLPPLNSLVRWALVLDFDPGYPFLDDDERDADGDGLGNWDEQHGRMNEAWWPQAHDGTNAPKESRYPNSDYLDNEDTARLDAGADRDLDGDGVVDGADDTDGDGLSNQFEVNRPFDWDSDAWSNLGGTPVVWASGPNPWAYTNPFNPCKPFDSERCHAHPPLAYYSGDQRPPIGPPAPPTFPGSIPVTPDGF